MTTTERAAVIRQQLKARGISSRQVSVRSDYYSMGSSIDVTIKDASIRIDLVKEIAEAHESISRCSVTGEILGGGNRYVSVRYSSAAIDAAAAPLVPLVEAALAQIAATDDRSLIPVEGTPYLVGRDSHTGWGLTVWQDGFLGMSNTVAGVAEHIAKLQRGARR